MKTKTLLIAIIACLLPITLQAGEPICHVTHYDEFSGLAQWNATQIVQDKQGMIWFATWNGLNRFDGYEFECFKSKAGDGVDMPSDRIRDILLDNNGNLLCQYDDRVFLFDIRTCKYQSLSPQKEKEMMAMFTRRSQKAQVQFSEAHPISHQDKWGVTWQIFRDGTIRYQEKGSNTWVPYHPNIEPKPSLYYSLTDKEGNVWMRSEYGAYKFTFTQKPYTPFPQEKATQTRCFFLDQKGRYWITTRNDATIRLYDKSNNLIGYMSQRGSLQRAYTSFGSPIYHIYQDKEGTYWLCSKPNGLFRLRETSNGTFSVEQFKHEEGNPNSLPNNDLYYSATDQLGRLWVATFSKGIACVEHPQERDIQFVHMDNGLKYPKDNGARTRQILITEKGILLAPSTTGLIVADVSKKDVRQITFKLHTRNAHRSTSLSNNATMFVTEDSKHRIFVCTESGGINQIVSEDLLQDELEFKHFDTTTGLPSDITLSAIEDGNHLLIVSSNQLITLRPDDNYSEGFGTSFFHEKFRFSDAVPMLLPDGRRIFGLQDGAFTIMPSSLKKSGFVPSIALTSISVENNKPNHAVNALDTLILSSHERNVTINFSALDYAGNDDIHYAFLMGNDEGAWNYIEKTHSATFLDLRPGTHLLRIRSTNSDGVWVDNTRTLTIIVKPTFWETTWAKILYILLIALIMYAILRTHRHISELNKKQKETHEAYLALLNHEEYKAKNEELTTEETPTEPTITIKPEDEAFMKRAMKFIEEHIGDPNINIGDMAEATATSRSGLNRKMKSLLGVTPLDFIREARIRKACKMLATGMSVNDVAYSCGFSDPKYFGKCFKADMGMTPTEYKIEHKAK
ncbi:MAG: helix-turn-helix domain-containing protein [Prevotella sp.]|nr:helix-turn-helix domain-containing protein [Prevotella sp.]